MNNPFYTTYRFRLSSGVFPNKMKRDIRIYIAKSTKECIPYRRFYIYDITKKLIVLSGLIYKSDQGRYRVEVCGPMLLPKLSKYVSETERTLSDCAITIASTYCKILGHGWMLRD